MKKGVEKTMMEWEPVNSRLMKNRLRGKQINTTIVKCYMPQQMTVMRTSRMNSMNTLYYNTPRHDMMIVMGDLNVKEAK